MKIVGFILKLLAALAAIAGLVYVIATYGDKIVLWAKKLLGICDCDCQCACECEGDCDDCQCEDDCDDCACEGCCNCDAAQEALEEEVEEEVEEEAEEEAPAEEAVQAEESDFEG